MSHSAKMPFWGRRLRTWSSRKGNCGCWIPTRPHLPGPACCRHAWNQERRWTPPSRPAAQVASKLSENGMGLFLVSWNSLAGLTKLQENPPDDSQPLLPAYLWNQKFEKAWKRVIRELSTQQGCGGVPPLLLWEASEDSERGGGWPPAPSRDV